MRPYSLVFAAIVSACNAEPAPTTPDDAWSFVVLPDTQVYSRLYPEIFEAQTEWIAAERDTLNIQFVLHVGDVTDTNAPEEWRHARQAMAVLDGVVPYAIVPGNHDYGRGGSGYSRETYLNEYFPYEEQSSQSHFAGAFEEGRLDNTFHVFETPSGPWMVFALEFAPRPEVLAWAGGLADRHHGVPATVVTHAYLYEDGTRYDRHRPSQLWAPRYYGLGRTGADGQKIWSDLIAERPSVEMVVSGHVLGRGVARLSSARTNGPPTHQLLANFQHTELGGNGYLRIVEVHSDRFVVRTYSPYAHRYRHGDDHEFELARTWSSRTLLAGR